MNPVILPACSQPERRSGKCSYSYVSPAVLSGTVLAFMPGRDGDLRERERERKRDRQTDRQKDRQRERKRQRENFRRKDNLYIYIYIIIF